MPPQHRTQKARSSRDDDFPRFHGISKNTRALRSPRGCFARRALRRHATRSSHSRTHSQLAHPFTRPAPIRSVACIGFILDY